MNSRCIAYIAGMVLSAAALRADPLIEISPFYGYRFGGEVESSFGESLDLKAGQSYGVALNVTPGRDRNKKMEILWSRQESGVDLADGGGSGTLDMTVDEFMIGGVLETGEGKLRGYMTGLVGATLFEPEGCESEVRFGVSLGVGVKYFLLPNLALRADLRGYCTVVESEGALISTGNYTVAYFSGSALWQGEVSAGITLAF